MAKNETQTPFHGFANHPTHLVPPPSPSPALASLASSRTCQAHPPAGFCTSCFCCLGTAKASFFSTSDLLRKGPSSGATHVHPNLHHFCLVLFSWRDITFLGLAGLSKAHSQCLTYKPQGLTLALMNHASHVWYSQFWSISKTKVFPLSPDGTISEFPTKILPRAPLTCVSRFSSDPRRRIPFQIQFELEKCVLSPTNVLKIGFLNENLRRTL